MSAKVNFLNSINRVAETAFLIKPILENSLKKNVLTAEWKKTFWSWNYDNYYEVWTWWFSDKFFDMSIIVKLGTEIEMGLKYYYMEKVGHKNLRDLMGDTNHTKWIFQRLLPWSGDNVMDLYKRKLQTELISVSKFSSLQEIMLLRHLYAHNSWLLDDKFIQNYHRLTREDILTLPEINWVYPQEDVYFFKPLKKLSNFIEDSRHFINEFP